MLSCRYCRIQKHAQHCLLQVLARFRNSRGHRGRAFTQVPAVPGPTVTALPQVLDGGIAFPDRIAVPQVLAVPKRSHSHAHNSFPQYWQESDSRTKARRNRFHPSNYGHFQNPPYCIQNHAENALPQVLTGFRTNRRRGGIAFPQTTMLCPKYWRDSESINGMGESFSPGYWRFLDPP